MTDTEQNDASESDTKKREAERVVDATVDSSKGSLKFLSPSNSEWRELNPKISDKDPEKEVKLRKAKEARELIKEILLSALQMPNILVLAGSGTSLGPTIGGPSMWDLWDHTMHESPSTVTEQKPKLRKESEHIINKVGYELTIQGENIEAFLSRCEAFLEVHDDSEVKKFVNECKSTIMKRCTNFLIDGPTNEWKDEKLDGHKIFLHRLSRRRVRDPRLKIFTTNYDLCFERAASLKGLITIDGFSFTQPRKFSPSYFEYDIVRRSSLSSEVGDPLEGVFHLLKLHGSVNWERDENGGICETLLPDPAKACLIYPASGKYQQTYLQPHLELMAQYLACLRQPNTCLIVAGFGFNDDHLAEPILAAITSNAQLRIVIADYQAEDYLSGKIGGASRYWAKLKELAKFGENIWFINGSFDDFAKLLPDLKALTPAQQLEKQIRQLGVKN